MYIIFITIFIYRTLFIYIEIISFAAKFRMSRRAIIRQLAYWPID